MTGPGTVAAKWRVNGESDPHGDRYDLERSTLCGGHMTDDELANHVFMDGDGEPDIMPGLSAKKFGRIGRLTAAKDRIRWLSRKFTEVTAALDAVTAQLAAAEKERDEFRAYAFEATKAITNHVGGGSELFSGRIAKDAPREMFKADIPFCMKRLRERDELAHDHWISAASTADTLRKEIDRMRSELSALRAGAIATPEVIP